MASIIDICNLALSRLGDRANITSIDPPEGSAQADHCARFYPLARDVALEARHWTFNTVRVAGSAVLATTPASWLYAYAKPNDCLKIVGLVDNFEVDWWMADPIPYTVETDLLTGQEVILTNHPSAVLVYQTRVDDPARYPPQFVSALAWLLASYLAGSVIKGKAGREAGLAAWQAWQTECGSAAAINANQSLVRRSYTSDSMRARGGSVGWVPDAPIIGGYGWYAYPSSVSPLNG